MIYLFYVVGGLATLAGAAQVWVGIRYFLAQLRSGDVASGTQLLQLALINASARVFIGVQFFSIVAWSRGLGPRDAPILWPSIAAAISLIMARIYAHYLKRSGAV